MLYLILFMILCNPCLVCKSARILAYFPMPSLSHQVVFRPLTQELARRGHEVVVLTTDPAFSKEEAPANLTEVDLHNISYSKWKKFLAISVKEKETDHIKQLDVGLQLILKIVEAQIKTKEVQMLINDPNQKFDVILLEAFIWSTLTLVTIFNAPIIQISTFGSVRGSYENIGAPVHPFLYPEIMHPRIYNLTFWEKIQKLHTLYVLEDMYMRADCNDDQVMKKVINRQVPNLAELRKKVDNILFINFRSIWQDNRPIPPSVNLIGGIHVTTVKALPEDLKKYLDNSKYGFIFVSFGTNVDTSMLPPEKVRIMMKVFSKVPYDILLKWNTDTLPGIPKNVIVKKWFPQADLFNHAKIKLFICQGGLQSTDEALQAGVPLIGIPFITDQHHNTEKYEKLNIGIKLDLDFIDEEVFEKAINTAIDDQSFKNNVIRLRSIIQDQPQTPLERAVWWVEYVIRHGGSRHLRAPAANISLAEYLELELVLIVLMCLLCVMIFVMSMAYFAWARVCVWSGKVGRGKMKDD